MDNKGDFGGDFEVKICTEEINKEDDILSTGYNQFRIINPLLIFRRISILLSNVRKETHGLSQT